MTDNVTEIFDKLKNLYISKNQNYGNSVGETPPLAPDVSPEKACRVRMGDKIKRLEKLFSGEPDKVGESLTDTVGDLAVYCIIWLALTKKEIE